jgi:hypothetical protein
MNENAVLNLCTVFPRGLVDQIQSATGGVTPASILISVPGPLE